MIQVLSNSWALLLGMGLLMIGNGLQATLMGVRGSIEGFSTLELSFVTSAYFVGFLGSSILTPLMIRRVGHVRVFAALGSFVSAALILFPAVTEVWAWTILRMVVGFCFCGLYVTAESWLNHSATNETRGQTLSAYMIVQMTGIISGQALLNSADPAGWLLFVIPSVLVSIAFTPILLSVTPTPAFDTTKAMDFIGLFRTSPLTVVGMFLLGGIFAAQFGMSAIYGTEAGLSVTEISTFVAAFFIGAMLLQYPIGWLSDRMDRRILILISSALGGTAALAGLFLGSSFALLVGVAFIVGGVSNPLYSLFIAYLNDYLPSDDMPAASAGLLFVNGVGAIVGPPAIGLLMRGMGPSGFWVLVATMLLGIAIYAAYRMSQRSAPAVEDTGAFVSVLPTASPIAVEVAQEWAIEQAEEAEEAGDAAQPAS